MQINEKQLITTVPDFESLLVVARLGQKVNDGLVVDLHVGDLHQEAPVRRLLHRVEQLLDGLG